VPESSLQSPLVNELALEQEPVQQLAQQGGPAESQLQARLLLERLLDPVNCHRHPSAIAVLLVFSSLWALRALSVLFPVV
jgi:hypothetical protein